MTVRCWSHNPCCGGCANRNTAIRHQVAGLTPRYTTLVKYITEKLEPASIVHFTLVLHQNVTSSKESVTPWSGRPRTENIEPSI